MHTKIANSSQFILNQLSSSWFTFAVIGLFVLQAAWIALSFRYSLIYDEGFHFGIINVYTDHLWPVIYNQPESYDIYRDFAGEGSKLFHFLMSFPQRIFEAFGLSQVTQVILHRLLNVAMVALGLYFFAKLFDKLKIKRLYTNVALLIFTLLPMSIFVAATINYDNALFLLTPLFITSFIIVIRARHFDIRKILSFLTIGLVASLVKFTFLPIFAIFSLMTVIMLIRRYKKTIGVQFRRSLGQLNSAKTVMLTIIFTVTSFLFIQTYVVNVVQYGTPRPTCQQTLGTERCLANAIIERNERLINSEDTRNVENRAMFSLTWTKAFLHSSFMTGANTDEGKRELGFAPPLFQSIFWLFTVAGVLILVYSWRSMRFSTEIKLITAVFISYTALIFIQGMSLYYFYSAPVAIQSRYLLIFVPFIIVLIVMASVFVTKKVRFARLPLLFIVLLLFTQGGGLTTHLLASDESWYWDNGLVEDVNETAKDVIAPLVKEH